MPEEAKPFTRSATTGLGAGILASAVLAAITIAVFYVLQDYGPESALRKYNEAIIDGDVQAYDQTSVQPFDDPYSVYLVRSVVAPCLERGGRLRLISMDDRLPTYAIAQAAYVFPDNTPAIIDFVITKQDHIWKVNPFETRKLAARRNLGLTGVSVGQP